MNKPGGTFFVSSFFIGLSFCSGLFAGNVAPPIQDFLSRVNIWDGKKTRMEILVSVSTTSYFFNMFYVLAIVRFKVGADCYIVHVVDIICNYCVNITMHRLIRFS